MSILIPAGVLDPPLLEIDISKVYKYHTGEENFTKKYFVAI